MQYNTTQHNTTQHITTQHNATQRNAAQCNTIQQKNGEGYKLQICGVVEKDNLKR